MTNAQRLSFQKSVNNNAIKRASEAIQATGRALPCRVVSVDGAIVTVAFEMNTAPWTIPNITIPKAESNWIRMPTQVGDLGMTMPADVYLGGVSHLGGGVADFTPVTNLSALVFVPISNASSHPSDPNAAIVQGPNGFIGQTTEGTTSSIVTDVNGTTVTYASNTATVNAAGVMASVGSSLIDVTAASITLTAGGHTLTIGSGGVIIDGIPFSTHAHLYSPGGGTPTDSGPPV